MKRGAVLLCFTIMIVTAPSAVVHAATLDCAGGIISVGDSRVELLSKCGEPDAKESHEEELSLRPDHKTKHKLSITVDEWTYDFGPERFMRIVTLKNGKIADVRSGNYGRGSQAKPDQRECGEQVISIGDTKTDVVAKCGEPTWKDSRQEEMKERLESGVTRSIFLNVEEWTYNLGPNRFVRIFTFKNGRLTDSRTGGYGYEMKQEDKRKAP